jgi:hypothetical protein
MNPLSYRSGQGQADPENPYHEVQIQTHYGQLDNRKPCPDLLERLPKSRSIENITSIIIIAYNKGYHC